MNPNFSKGHGKLAMSEDAIIIARRLRQVGVGETITYADLTALIERDVRGEARYCMTSAQRRVRREDGFLFAVVRTVGLRRLANNEKVPHSGRRIISAQRQIRRGDRELKTVIPGQLTEAERHGFYIQCGKFGAIKLALSGKMERRIIQVVDRSRATLTMRDLEQLFTPGKSKPVVIRKAQ